MPPAPPPVCHLAHSGFRLLGEPVFRLSEGQKVPSMVVQLDNQEAVLPLRSVAREFKIDPASPDGQMLALIEQALDFVVALRIGDKLPSEISGGEASWSPSAQDQMLALSRIKYELVRCVFARTGEGQRPDGSVRPGWEDDGTNRQLLRRAMEGAAQLLGLPDAEEVEARIATLGSELAFIEAMRRAVSRGITAMQEKLLKLRADKVPASRRDALHQVQMLARRGIKEITLRVEQADARLDDMLGMLREVNESVAWMRRQRDWLFRTNHAWEPVFTDWINAPAHIDEFLWKVIERTYAFLAPRFMSFQEWSAIDLKPAQPALRAKVW